MIMKVLACAMGILDVLAAGYIAFNTQSSFWGALAILILIKGVVSFIPM